MFSFLSPSILNRAMSCEITLPFPVAYITRDLERALGIPQIPGFFIMTNETAFGKSQCKVRSDIFFCSQKRILDTHELLLDEKILSTLRDNHIAHIMVFKPTTAIERAAKANGLTVLNPPASLASSFEEKITQLSFLPELKNIFVPFHVMTLKEVLFSGTPFVLQFNHAHTGNGTHYIDSEKKLTELQMQFPERPVRMAPFITGPLFTNNNIVTKQDTLVGNINCQITGLEPFTKNIFATIGNDWALPHILLSAEETNEYYKVAKCVGDALKKRNWKGMFGIDVLYDMHAKKFFLLEINARQSASATFESFLQTHAGKQITTMEAHLMALIEKPIDGELQPISEGAQVTQKNILPAMPPDAQHTLTQTFEREGYRVTPYENTEREQEWLRIQTTRGGLMQNHNTLNTAGKQIADILRNTL